MTLPPSAGTAGTTPQGIARTVVRWTLLALCVGLFVYTLTLTDLGVGWERIVAIGPLVVVILLPFPAALTSDALAWRRLLAALGRRVGLWNIVRVRLSAEAVSMSTPGGAIWAEALAPVLLAKRSGVPIADVVGASAARRWLVVRMHGAYVAGAAIVGFPALSRASHALVESDALVVVVVAGALGLVLVALGIETLTTRGKVGGRVSDLLGGTRLTRLQSWIATRRHHFSDTDAAIGTLSKDRPALLAASVHLLGLWLIEGCETFLILRLLGADLGLATVMSFDAALSVVRSAAVFAPAGIGVQDLGYLTVLEAYGVPPASGVAPAFIVLKRLKEAFWIAIGYLLLAIGPASSPGAGDLAGDVDVTERLGGAAKDMP